MRVTVVLGANYFPFGDVLGTARNFYGTHRATEKRQVASKD